MQVVTLSFFRFSSIAQRLWAFSQMQGARAPLARCPEIGFHKLLGTGTGEGFTPYPDFSVYSVLATWPSMEAARRAIAEAPVFRRYRDHASESWTVYLTATRVRGEWAGVAPFRLDSRDPEAGLDKIAVLTRASVKPRHAVSFWRHVPNIEETIREQTHLLFKKGLGEIPLLHQVTFSIWDDQDAMRAFAYRGFHNEAIEAVRKGDWFTEELFARFQVLGAEGSWEGVCPLTRRAAPVPEQSIPGDLAARSA